MVDAPGLIRPLRRCCFTPSPERTSLKKKTRVRPLPSEKTWQFGGTHRFSEIGVSDAASN
jgi:hypothetical protein